MLISKHSLIELNNRINDIDKYLRECLENDISEKVCELKTKSYYKGFSDEQLRAEATPAPYENNITIYAFTNDGYRIILESIDALVKQETLRNYSFKTIAVKIKRGTHSINLILRHSIEDTLTYELEGLTEEQKREVIFQINEWIEILKPTKVISIWNALNGVLKVVSFSLLFMIGVMYLLINLTRDNSYYYKSDLKKIMQRQIEDGIKNIDDANQALTSLLMYSSDYVPKAYKHPQADNKIFIIIVIIGIVLFIISFSPKTRFELGKEKQIYNFQKIWIKIMLYIIPVLIVLPILINIVTK